MSERFPHPELSDRELQVLGRCAEIPLLVGAIESIMMFGDAAPAAQLGGLDHWEALYSSRLVEITKDIEAHDLSRLAEKIKDWAIARDAALDR